MPRATDTPTLLPLLPWLVLNGPEPLRAPELAAVCRPAATPRSSPARALPSFICNQPHPRPSTLPSRTQEAHPSSFPPSRAPPPVPWPPVLHRPPRSPLLRPSSTQIDPQESFLVVH
jgi:hypothetical protein